MLLPLDLALSRCTVFVGLCHQNQNSVRRKQCSCPFIC